MKKIIIFSIFILSIIVLSGCTNHHAFDFNSSSTANCSVQCEDLMNQYHCFEASPSYESSYINGEQTKGQCSCYIRGCYS
jgi:hypothetical protein